VSGTLFPAQLESGIVENAIEQSFHQSDRFTKSNFLVAQGRGKVGLALNRIAKLIINVLITSVHR
jgi:hypothetical protein